MTLATIDIGTNTTLLLVARPRERTGSDGDLGAAIDTEVLADEAEITRLGKGIGGDGRLHAEGIARTLDVLRRYAAVAAQHQARIVAVGTEALRRAPNASELLVPAAEVLGVPVEVIDGDREAALTFAAVAASFSREMATSDSAIVDIGGGSTEIVIADHGHMKFRRSLPLGSVRLTETHIRHDPPTADEIASIENEIDAALNTLPRDVTDQSIALLVGVAGTVTSLSAMALRLPSYDPARVHGSTLRLAELDRLITALRGATQAERERMIGLDPRRADVILAGALILRSVARSVGGLPIRVSDRGIRWGLFFEHVA